MATRKVFTAGICVSYTGDVFFLRSVESGDLFLYCNCCGTATRKPPKIGDYDDLEWQVLAPKGVALPTRDEIEAAGMGHLIEGEEEYDGDDETGMWDMWATTYMEEGNLARALALCDDTIRTWHCVPWGAHELRATVLRRMGRYEEADYDMRREAALHAVPDRMPTFAAPRPNLYESAEGFSVDVIGRSEIVYREGERAVRVEAELLSPPRTMAVYASSIKAWESPSGETISDAERRRICDNIARAFVSQGMRAEID